MHSKRPEPAEHGLPSMPKPSTDAGEKSHPQHSNAGEITRPDLAEPGTGEADCPGCGCYVVPAVTGAREVEGQWYHRQCAPQPRAPFIIGTTEWPGIAKLMEECGELVQACGKLLAYPDGPHPDGGNTRDYLHDEIADVMAAIEFVQIANAGVLDNAWINDRRDVKLQTFRGWHGNPR